MTLYEQTIAELSYELEQTRLTQDTQKQMATIPEENNDLCGTSQQSSDDSDVVDMTGDVENFEDKQDDSGVCDLAELETQSASGLQRNNVREYMQGNLRESMLMQQNRTSFISQTHNSFIANQQ